jgi:hypothetical protein
MEGKQGSVVIQNRADYRATVSMSFGGAVYQNCKIDDELECGRPSKLPSSVEEGWPRH